MTATYRLQLTPDFGFREVRELLPYFQALGVSHLYLSPISEARPGSSHGYDVVDHNAIRSDFGGREGFEALREGALEHGLGLVLDYVPNHAGVGPRNTYWQDVLAYGKHSPYAAYFDIDWHPLKPELHDKLLLPFLGAPYGEVFDRGEIVLGYRDGRLYATYYDNRYALSPATYHLVLEALLPKYERQEVYFDLKDLAVAYAGVAPDERERAETLRARLVTLAADLDLDADLAAIQGAPLHDLLERQPWRLSYWQTAGYEINYRRFFDINGLVGLAMERPQVFWDAHQLLGELLAADGVDGVRIDHVDGLFDPHGYLRLLRELGAPRIWVEKILAHGETLPDGWPVEGTTGYEFMNDALGVLLCPDGEIPLDKIYRRHDPQARLYERVVYRSKELVMSTTLSSGLFRLAYELDRLSEADYHTRDFTLEALREALAEVVAAFERYRTYLPQDPEEAEEVLLRAVHVAKQRNPAFEPTVFDFILDVVLGRVADRLEEARAGWVGRFQQYTAPVAAKGVEDTAFYRYLRLIALNEVGGEPDHFGVQRTAFHARARFRCRRYPRNLLATATHDHKRGEDTRMRLVALAEIPHAWEETVQALDAIAHSYATLGRPSRGDIYLFYQLLAALWAPAPGAEPDRPGLAHRLDAYMLKAARESKLHTSWINDDTAYESALSDLVRGVCMDERTPSAIGPFADRLATLGFHNTLSQLVLKLTTPGVPDVYQGTELFDLSLVDPDNRRPVDYDLCRWLLGEVEAMLVARSPSAFEDLVRQQDRRAKLYVLRALLALRQAHLDLFMQGEYHALVPEGEAERFWICFARTCGGDALLVAVPRFPAARPIDGPATLPLPDALAGRDYTDVLTGRVVDLGDALDLTAAAPPWRVLFSEG